MNSFTDTTPSLKTQERHRPGPRAEVPEDRAFIVFATLHQKSTILIKNQWFCGSLPKIHQFSGSPSTLINLGVGERSLLCCLKCEHKSGIAPDRAQRSREGDRAFVVFSTLRVSGDIDLQEFAGWSYQENFLAHIKKYLDHTKLH